eukprot:gnl/Carplike_NY0171/5714_a7838_219.p1 GENE.gnl/Carplike_NY0171/5714_a7838_219~~gnl/Carplike_NY0171/5714_a7838_219.p1  ORF type:complete len:450 (+),score=114.48 gnl/Carplike_NY0171/5714_a7838_219:1-1350(+)
MKSYDHQRSSPSSSSSTPLCSSSLVPDPPSSPLSSFHVSYIPALLSLFPLSSVSLCNLPQLTDYDLKRLTLPPTITHLDIGANDNFTGSAFPMANNLRSLRIWLKSSHGSSLYGGSRGKDVKDVLAAVFKSYGGILEVLEIYGCDDLVDFRLEKGIPSGSADALKLPYKLQRLVLTGLPAQCDFSLLPMALPQSVDSLILSCSKRDKKCCQQGDDKDEEETVQEFGPQSFPAFLGMPSASSSASASSSSSSSSSCSPLFMSIPSSSSLMCHFVTSLTLSSIPCVRFELLGSIFPSLVSLRLIDTHVDNDRAPSMKSVLPRLKRYECVNVSGHVLDTLSSKIPISLSIDDLSGVQELTVAQDHPPIAIPQPQPAFNHEFPATTDDYLAQSMNTSLDVSGAPIIHSGPTMIGGLGRETSLGLSSSSFPPDPLAMPLEGGMLGSEEDGIRWL